MKSLDCLTLAIVVIGGLSIAAAPPAWATDTKKSAPPPPPPRAAPPPARPAPMPQARPAQVRPPAAAAARPNPAVPAHPQTAARPAAKLQARAAERRETPGTVARPAESARPSEPRPGIAAGRVPAALGGQHPGLPSAQSRFNERVRDPAREREAARAHEHDFHTRDVRRFDVREREHWRTGRWHNDFHYGRFGWWYEVDDVWYAYPAPIFPYPLVVAPIIVEDAVGPVAVDEQLPPAAVGLAALPPLPKAAYHCVDPEGFFPAVEACNIEWVAVGAH